MTDAPPVSLTALCALALAVLVWGCDALPETPAPSALPVQTPMPTATPTLIPTVTEAPISTPTPAPARCDPGTPWPLEALIPPL